MSPDETMTGGILRGIEDGWFMAEIAEASFDYQRQLEKGDKRVVGVNCHTETVEKPVEILRVSHEVEVSQVRELARRRAGRDAAAADAAMAALMSAARSGENMIPPMIAAASAEVTLGEICGALRAEWGGYAEAPAF